MQPIFLTKTQIGNLLATTPEIGRTHIPFALDECKVLLVDDVLFTGRTIRSALEAVLDHGRPQCVQLLVLMDRGHRVIPAGGLL